LLEFYATPKNHHQLASVAVFCGLRWRLSNEVVVKAPKSTKANPEVGSGTEIGSSAVPKVKLLKYFYAKNISLSLSAQSL
jgi:hypothetical protein